MFVRVTVDPAEKIPAAAAKTWKTRGQVSLVTWTTYSGL